MSDAVNPTTATTASERPSERPSIVIIRTKYQGPTERRGSCIVARGECHRLARKREIKSYDHRHNVQSNHALAAGKLAQRWFLNARCLSWTSSAHGDGFVFVFAI